MEKKTVERLRLSVEGNLGLTLTVEDLEPMAREAEEHGACTRTFGEAELTLFAYRRGSVCAAVNVVEIGEDDEEED